MKKIFSILCILSSPVFATPHKIRANKVEVIPSPISPHNTKKVDEHIICLNEQIIFQNALNEHRINCSIELSKYANCANNVSDSQASNTGKGALIGLGAAIFTGGASLLIMGAGAVVGYSLSEETLHICGVQPKCDSNTLMQVVQNETGLKLINCK